MALTVTSAEDSMRERRIRSPRHVRQHAAGQLLDLFLGLVTGDLRGVVDEKRDHPPPRNHYSTFVVQ